ncbi:MAG: DUF4294 domain-containing protein [Porphyromonas sp.]|nr:DUF4294 domain-containing protein [Porphyromonas sp.]
MKKLICSKSLVLVLALVLCGQRERLFAQGYFDRPISQDSMMLMIVEGRDTVFLTMLPNLIVREHRYKSLTPQERSALWRRIRDVRITLPYAKEIAAQLIETYEYLQTLPNEKLRRRHLKQIEKDLMTAYKPKMKGLTLRQGKLLIKLIARQCNQTSYQIVDAFFGGWKATWWNFFAGFFGASLKTKYNPESDPDDATTERIIMLIESGRL